MRAFEITTTKSGSPFLVLAEGFMEAVGILQRQKNVRDDDIINVRLLDTYNSDKILMDKESLEEKVRHELLEKMPKWKPEPNGVSGCADGNDLYLIRSARGYYFTSPCIGGANYYLELESLEQLAGLPKNQ